MRCPKCGKGLMTEEENIKWGFCTDCFNDEWSKKMDDKVLQDLDGNIRKATNLLNNYRRLQQDYGNYEDAVAHYENYVKYLRSLKL